MDGEQQRGDRRSRTRPERIRGGGIFTGLTLIGIGTLFLMHNLRVFDIDWDIWPLFLVLFGLVRLIQHRGRSGGLWLVGIGLWLYANENRLWDLDYENSWPLLLVFGGLIMVWKALRKNIPSSDPSGTDDEEAPRDGGS